MKGQAAAAPTLAGMWGHGFTPSKADFRAAVDSYSCVQHRGEADTVLLRENLRVLLGLVSVSMSSWENDTNVYMVVANNLCLGSFVYMVVVNNLRHGSFDLVLTELILRELRAQVRTTWGPCL